MKFCNGTDSLIIFFFGLMVLVKLSIDQANKSKKSSLFDTMIFLNDSYTLLAIYFFNNYSKINIYV